MTRTFSVISQMYFLPFKSKDFGQFKSPALLLQQRLFIMQKNGHVLLKLCFFSLIYTDKKKSFAGPA